MTLLAASILALFAGPALLGVLRSNRRLESGLDGFVLVAIAGLVLFELLPESVALGGSWAIAAGVAGFFIPLLAEHTVLGFGRGDKCSRLVLNLALAGLATHAFLDGIALTDAAHLALHEGHDHSTTSVGPLALGVLLHRFPVGLAIWAIVRPGRGPKLALLMLAMIAGATIGGYHLGSVSVANMPMSAFGIFQALVAGSLVHVVFHRPGHAASPPEGGLRWAAFLGAIAALVLLSSSTHQHGDGAHDGSSGEIGATFLMLALESAPALLLAFIAGGLLKVFLPTNAVAWLGRGGRLSQAMKGMGFGLPLPVCSCGVVPLYQSLVTQGLPPAAALAFLVATPELGVDALLVSLPLLGMEMTAARLICAAAVAVAVAVTVSRFMPPASRREQEPPSPEIHESRPQRIQRGLRYGFEDLVDDTMPWILAGLAIAAVANPLLDAAWIRELPTGLEIPLFALLGMPVYVCAAGATPIVAVLLMHGVSPGAGIAFLLTGPATNLTTYGVLSELHGRRPAMLFGLAVAMGAIGVGFATDGFFADTLTSPLTPGHTHHESLPEQLALGALALAFAWSILRRGPREQFAKILPAAADGSHEGHGHDASSEDATASCCGGDAPPVEEPKPSCCGDD